MIVVLALAGCLSIPDSIGKDPGAITPENAADVLSAASPDLPYLLYQTVVDLKEQTYRTCPEISIEETGASGRANGCADSAQITWSGSFSYEEDLLTEAEKLSFSKLSVVDTGADWVVSGTIEVTRGEGNSAATIESRFAITALGEVSKDFWVNTRGVYTMDESEFLYADTYEGTVGLEGFGLAEVSATRVAVGFVNYCKYGAAGIGSLAALGTNRADYRFNLDASGMDPDYAESLEGPPGPTTGPTTTTGTTTTTTTTTGTTDTGTDTGTTAGTDDTGATTTGTDTGTDTGTTVDDTDNETCGCANISVDEASVEACALPATEFAFPFVAVY